jgi:hypothetical protein
LEDGHHPNRPKTFAHNPPHNPTIPQKVTNVSIYERGPGLYGAPALFVSIPLGRRLKGRKGMFRRRNQQEEAQEKGSQEPGVVPWQEAAFKLLVFELVSVGIPLLLLRLINKLLTRSS